MFLSLLRGAKVVSKCQAMNRRVLTEPKTMLGLMVLELASLEKKKERKKMIFDRFLGFYKAERKSEDIFVLRRVRAFHYVDLELSYDVLSPLPIVLSKHFNHKGGSAMAWSWLGLSRMCFA